ncbi:uncharacterized protein JCM15063_004777 [Sporobolomyces koalae]|uniref:uncharacterized protein n=1 Tax=Sporobolomyces koalae TaxID=500713 RepID=UPI003177DB14
MTQLPVETCTSSTSEKDHLATTFDFAAELYEAPSVTAATFLPAGWSTKGYTQVEITASHKSLTALTKRTTTETVTLDSNGSVVARSSSVPTSDEVKCSLLSPDGSRLAQFRVIAGKQGKEAKRVVEIFSGAGDRKLDEINVTKETGDFYFDATFGGPRWHPDNEYIVFTAEAPAPKGSDDPYARPAPEKFRYTPDYGETFTGKKEPTLFLIALSGPARQSGPPARASLHRLTFPTTGGEHVNFGQPIFVPQQTGSDLKLLATGYSSLPDDRKLGIVYCANRPARIYELAVTAKEEQGEKRVFETSNVTPLSPADQSARSPRVFYSGAESQSPEITAVYVSNRLGGAHSSCATLRLLTLRHDAHDWEDKEIVPVVPSPKSVDDFPGLYIDQLPSNESFLSLESGLHLAFASIWRSRRVPLLVNLTDGQVTSLAPWPKADEDDVVLPYLHKEQELNSFSVFGTDGAQRVLASRSGPTRVPEIVLADLKGNSNLDEVTWLVIRKTSLSPELTDALSKLSSTVLPLPKFLASEIILVSPVSINPAAPASINLPPLSLTGHGGPNSTSTTNWDVTTAVTALAGFRVAFCNYPGSLGFGQEFVDALAPELGTLEVNAVLATKHYLNTLSLASGTRRKNVYTGGSHGGWIGSHLTSKYVDEFDACVMRNPVTDLPSMLASTDIPDWTYEEMTVEYSLSSPPVVMTPELFDKLHKASPLALSAAVKTPTLLLVGKNDRRVPPDQARQWYHSLKNNTGRDGKPLEVQMLAFEGEGHPITNEVENEWVAFEQGLRFMAKHVAF